MTGTGDDNGPLNLPEAIKSGVWAGMKDAWSAEPDGVQACLDVANAWKNPARQREELAWSIEQESMWHPDALNALSGASGLIQWMEASAKKQGTTTAAIRKMNRKAQAPLIADFFKRVTKGNGPADQPGEVYLCIFAPGFQGQGDNVQIFGAGTLAAQQNKVLQSADGAIYVGNVRKHGIPPTKMPTGPMPGWGPPLPKLPTPADITKPFEDMGKLVLLALVLLAVSKADRG